MTSFSVMQELFAYLTGRKMLTIRKANYKQCKLFGIYLAKKGMFDSINYGKFLVIGIKQAPRTITEEEVYRIGFDSKEEYFSYGFNGFDSDNESIQVTKIEMLNVELLYGIVDELDTWIDSECFGINP